MQKPATPDMRCTLCGRTFSRPFLFAQTMRHMEEAHGHPVLRDREN